MLVTPSEDLFRYYQLILSQHKPLFDMDFPEQNILIYTHRQDGNMSWKRIPIEWSANDGRLNDRLGGWRACISKLGKLQRVETWQTMGLRSCGEVWCRIWTVIIHNTGSTELFATYASYATDGGRFLPLFTCSPISSDNELFITVQVPRLLSMNAAYTYSLPFRLYIGWW